MSKTQSKKFRAVPVLAAALSLAACVAGTSVMTDYVSAFAESESGVKKISADYTSYEETLRAGEDLNVELQSEGSVLLKNNNDALPLTSSERKVTLFGICSSHIVTGGGGSGGGTITDKMNDYDLHEGLEMAGFETNKAVKAFYDAQSNTNEVDQTGLDGLKTYEDSFKMYNDAAIVVIGRTGAEMSDRARSGYDTTEEDPIGKHYLELCDNEKALIDYVTQHFEKVVVLINSSNVMELGWLEDNEKVDSILWIGGTGTTGTVGVGKILSGEVNPSGKLVDIYMADLKKDPTWFNSGDLTHIEGGTSAMYTSEGLYAPSNTQYDQYNALVYKEGIYMGYRFYETAAAEGYFAEGKYDAKIGTIPEKYDGDAYYNRDTGVIYPFGYGMSYTSFAWSDYTVDIPEDANGDITVTVTVTNTGDVAGKDVVQVYAHSPYIEGEIEKSDVDLVAFDKTDLLEPGESQMLTITFEYSVLAQFDSEDANKNDKSVYEIDGNAEETYNLTLRTDSHTVKTDAEGRQLKYEWSIDDDICYEYSVDGKLMTADGEGATDGTKVYAMFSQGDIYDSLLGKDASDMGFVTRAGGKFGLPTTASVADLTYDKKYLEYMDLTNEFTPDEDYASDGSVNTAIGAEKWVRESKPASWTQADETAEGLDVSTLAGKSYTAPTYDPETKTWTESDDEDTKAWEEFLNKMSWNDLVTLVSNGQNGAVALESINLPNADYNDGPGQLKGGGNSTKTGDYGTYYVSHVVIASTWNTDLAEKQGQIIGNESLYLGTEGWWGPGANIHRTPFGGRNFEYYSQDGLQGGKIAAAVIKGVQKKGVQVFIKHLGANEQENLRAEPNNATVATEQALRQIYYKCFELAFTEGKCNGAMTCTTRTGVVASANNYAFLTELIRGEWGAGNALFMEDVEGENWHVMDHNLRAGNSLPLTDRTGRISGTWDSANQYVTVNKSASDTTQVVSYTQWYAVRSNAQRVIYSTINSNAMKNGYDLSAFADKTLAVAQKGVSYNASVGIKLSGVSIQSYSIVDGALPEGLTLSSDGTISGKVTNAEAKTYTFTVQVNCDLWVTKTADYSITVEEALTIDESSLAGLTAGTDSEFQIAAGIDAANYDEVVYTVTAGTLPEGMQINSQGLVYGTPTAAGDYTFTVQVKATKTEGEGTSATVTEDVLTREFTVTVAPQEFTYTVTFNTQGGSAVSSQSVAAGEKVTIPAAPTKDGYEFGGWYYDEACTAVADLGNAVDADITLYAKWVAPVASTAAESGCGSALNGGALALAGTSAIGLGAVLLLRKKEN